MLEVGRLCVKTCGRDATKHCVIIDKIDKNYVLVDGNTRRKKVNINHIEPLNKIFKIKKNETKEEILKIFEKEGIKLNKVKKNFEKKNSKKTEK